MDLSFLFVEGNHYSYNKYKVTSKRGGLMLKNELTTLLQIEYPIIQAPMAGGVTTTELVVASSKHGGLGMVGAGYMSGDQLKSQLKEIQKKTKSFGVNLFVPNEFHVNKTEVNDAKEILHLFHESLLIKEETTTLPTTETMANNFREQIQVIIEAQVPVCSFTFGVPKESMIKKLKQNGIIIIGTATTVDEAIEIERLGMDIVVVQGSEAGGHRGNFINETEESMIGLMSLIPQVVDHVTIPVIAAGGIMDGRGLVAAFALGAKAVQMGTAFLTTKESGAHNVHKEEILQRKEDETILTRSFSGKYARGIKNEFIQRMKEHEDSFPQFPIQNTLTQLIRKAASKENDKECMSLWSGQSPRIAKKQTVQQLMEHTITEAENVLNKLDVRL